MKITHNVPPRLPPPTISGENNKKDAYLFYLLFLMTNNKLGTVPICLLSFSASEVWLFLLNLIFFFKLQGNSWRPELRKSAKDSVPPSTPALIRPRTGTVHAIFIFFLFFVILIHSKLLPPVPQCESGFGYRVFVWGGGGHWLAVIPKKNFDMFSFSSCFYFFYLKEKYQVIFTLRR